MRGSGAYPATVRAFGFLVLTACRSGEVRGARWKEMDLEGREWRIPPERMKTGRERRVPLSAGALAGLWEGAHAFGAGEDRDLGIGAVPHGFRSSFRDWAAECSDAPRGVCELALAHVNTNRIEAAYRRTDLFERRRALMEQWAVFLTGPAVS